MMGQRHIFAMFAALCLLPEVASAQTDRGSIVIHVSARDGAPMEASGTIASAGVDFQSRFRTGKNGEYEVGGLPFGDYVIQANAPGFSAAVQRLHIERTLRQQLHLQLAVGTVHENVTVAADATLLDSERVGSAVDIGRAQLAAKTTPQPGRDLLDVVADQPGWVFEANGVPHPRGSEYETQFVVNGVPRTENLSPSFAAAIPAGDVDSAKVRTSAIPAEYGRSLGGIIDVTTGRTATRGWHGEVAASGGSFATALGQARLSFGTSRQELTLFGEGYRSDRYLDPPVLQNFTNRATGENARVDERFHAAPRDDFAVDFSQSSLHALVPNEAVQQSAGQRQDRHSRQWEGSASWQHTLSPDLLMTTAGGALDTAVGLESNAVSTPINVTQDRGFRQTWLRFDVAGQHGSHDWKGGADAILRSVHERFDYTITDPGQYDPGVQQTLHFADRRSGREPAVFAEDTFHSHNWNVAAGIRYDNYSLVLQRHGFSPRLAVSHFFPGANLLAHASYDRAFQFPAVENLLLASSPAVDSLSTFVERLPVEPGRGNYYELGLATAVANQLHLTANLYWRGIRNYADDDTLLNTGVSFPFTDRSAHIHGEEVSLLLPHWHRVLAQLSYSNQNGTARGPITGGLLLGSEGADKLLAQGTFPISQDQRNTARGQLRWDALRWLWLGSHVQYNSGLPVQFDSAVSPAQLAEQYGTRIVDRVNFARGRVRSWSSVDVAGGLNLTPGKERDLRLELHVTNIADGLNLINFAGLFSGTASAVPRSYDARLRFAF